jgi:uncharacterized protein
LCSNYLNLILMPTESCNFRCTYCYETFEHTKMTRSVTAGIKALIDRRSDGLDRLEISWFGGEPLLARDVITDISQHAARAARAYRFAFSASMTTNAYFLDRACFLECLANGVSSFHVTLDGSPDVHNTSRRLASGAATFDRVWANVTRLSEFREDFKILLRLHYTAENYRTIADFGRRVCDTLGNDRRFDFYFKSIDRLGGRSDDCINQLTSDQKRDVEAYLWRQSGLRRPEPSRQDRICYAAAGNSLIVRSTGRLAKCTVALNDDFNDIGFLAETGEVCVDQVKFRRWIAPVLEARWEDVVCPLASVARDTGSEAAR